MKPLDVKTVAALESRAAEVQGFPRGGKDVARKESCSVRHAGVAAELALDDLAHLEEIAEPRSLRAGRLLFDESDPAESLYSVVEGTMRICKLMPDGRRQITGFLTEGDFLGLADDDGYAYTAEAVTDCELLRYPMSKLRRMLERYPVMEHSLCIIARHELAEAQDHMLLLGRLTAPERVARFLLTRARHRPLGDSEESAIRLPMVRGDIADHLGLATETISRVLTGFETDCLIAIERAHAIRLLDRGRLEQVADGET